MVCSYSEVSFGLKKSWSKDPGYQVDDPEGNVEGERTEPLQTHRI